MKLKIRIMAALCAAFFMLPLFGITALAAPEEGIITEATPAPAIPAASASPAPVTDYPETPPRPFTPSGTGTVIDTATDSDGKMFYTIMTPDEHVFYLVIDRQRNTENVYFLNAVTIADLAALAELPETPQGGTVTPGASVTAPTETHTPETPVTSSPEPEPAPESGGNIGMMIVIAALVILGGGAGWYFKIYRPKQQGAASGEEYEPPETDNAPDIDDWGDADPFDGEDAPPWDEDEGRLPDESGDGE